MHLSVAEGPYLKLCGSDGTPAASAQTVKKQRVVITKKLSFYTAEVGSAQQ